MLFERHQLKAIHLLCNMKKEQTQNSMRDHKFRDRLVAFIGRKYRHQEKAVIVDSDPKGNRVPGSDVTIEKYMTM